jgi:hypothetical protein
MTKSTEEPESGEWEADLGFIDKELAKANVSVVTTDTKEPFVSLPSEGFPPPTMWSRNSQLAGDHAAAGFSCFINIQKREKRSQLFSFYLCSFDWLFL